MAMQLLTGVGENEVVETGTNVAIVPLGIPLLAGPGSIVAMMLAVQQARPAGVWGFAMAFLRQV